MQVLLDIVLQASVIVSDLRQVIGFGAALVLALLMAWASWHLTDLLMTRRQRLDED